VGGNIIIMEEAAYIDPQLFKKVIIPLVMMKDVVLLAISSPSDEVNYCSQLMTMRNRETGLLIFHVLLPGYQCNQCINSSTGEKCPHVYMTLPGHRSMRNLNIAISMLGNDKATIDQELLGKVKSATSYVFREFIAKFKKQPLREFKEDVQVCHTFIDPSGGSTKSDFAMSTHACENRNFILMGVSRYVNSADKMTDRLDIDRMFQQHFLKLWAIPKYENAHMIIYIELSDQLMTQTYANTILEYFPHKRHKIHIVEGYNKKPGQPGVLTTEADKVAWVRSLQKLFMQQAIHIAKDFISNDLEHIRDEIYDQFERYAREEEVLRDEQLAWKQAKVTYGGKRTGKDDIATAIAASIRHHKERLNSIDYFNWGIDNNIDRL
jgi:hypothetical protein